jgi:heat-inducible transcriptional repressor
MPLPELNDRERRILEAVIQSYVETAEPTGSRSLARRFGFGVSPATIRNTMSDLEEMGYLYHPHTSAGRVPTDMAYRVYVDSLIRLAPVPTTDGDDLRERLAAGGSTIETILRCAAQSLGVLTQELGIALGPRLDRTVLQRLELVRLTTERLLLVLTLRGGVMRTIFVEVPDTIADDALAEVTVVLNERLAGLTLREIRTSLAQRLRDTSAPGTAGELLNIFVQQGDVVFDVPLSDDEDVVLGQASMLAEQPEFASGESLRRLISLTETRQQLAELLRKRNGAATAVAAMPGLTITIGNEHADPLLDNLTIVTAEYHAGSLGGVIGVIGPTRMPYEKVISLVSHTSRLISALLD